MQDKNDLLSIAEQVAKQVEEEQQQQRRVIEAFVRGLQVEVELNLYASIVSLMGRYAEHSPEIAQWVKRRAPSFALDLSHALGILLRRELLPDEAKEQSRTPRLKPGGL